jgi:hypothetical protein
MKQLIIVLLILLTGCNEKIEKPVVYKYKRGDVVYLKLDKTKMMISKPFTLCTDQPKYEIYYKSSNGSYGSDIIEEFCLTDKP